MNERERAICARLKSFREQIKWPLEAFAQEIGISHHKLAGIEYARTPLKYKVAVIVCEVFDLNAEWIVTGKGEKHGVQPFLWVVESAPNAYGNRLLSEVYDSSPELFQSIKHEDIFKPVLESTALGCDPQNYLEKLVPVWFQGAKFRTPSDAQRFAKKVEELVTTMLELYLRAGTSSRVRISARQGKLGKVALSKDKDNLDSGKTGGIVAGMSAKDVPTWTQLKKTIARLTAEHGQKAALADEFGVSRQVLGNWLSSDKQGAPNAELTLRLFKWSLDPKRQQTK